MGLTIGVVGAGQFGPSFIPLFQAHPLVDDVYLAEVVPERRADQAARFGITEVFDTYQDLLATDIDAVAIFTQRWSHAPIALEALAAGKHVYSAVPAAITLDEMKALIARVTETGLTYLVGETSYYYPATVYCRERFHRGDFGRFVYGEGEYLHDMSVGFYEAYQYSGGRNWKATASFPPMLYPTHSTSMVLSVTGAGMTSVSCLGQVDQHDDGVFDPDVSRWNNAFSNQTALFRTSDGGMCRTNEFRRVGYRAHPEPEVRLSLFGTQASFEQQTGAYSWNTLDGDILDLQELLTCAESVPQDDQLSTDLQASFAGHYAPVHDTARLPSSFAGLPNGHQGSHQFLVDDFVTAIQSRTLPPNNVWDAARYCVPGMIAHESSQRQGALLEVPDLGAPPVQVGQPWP
jgi:predicted dehydrogenase